MNKLYDTKDKINFGQMRGCQFYWIYRLVPKYLEWLIRETDICFTNLKHFYSYGKPLIIKNNQDLDYTQLSKIMEKFGKKDLNKKSDVLVTIKILNEMYKTKIVSLKNFQIIDYTFSKELILINERKQVNCQINSNHNELSQEFDEIKAFYLNNHKHSF